MTSKEWYCQELSCKYRIVDGEIEYAPEMKDGSFEEYSIIDEDLVSEEPVVFQGKAVTLAEVYAYVRSTLGEKPKVTREEFLTYEKIRLSGVTNMWAVSLVVKLSKGVLDQDKCLYIMEHYTELAKKYLQ